MLLTVSCATLEQSKAAPTALHQADLLIATPGFREAAIASPEWTKLVLRKINELEANQR
jgi:hypothetical protein